MAPGSLKSALIKGSSERSRGRASQSKSKLMDHREPLVDDENVKDPTLLSKKTRIECFCYDNELSWTDCPPK